MSEEPIEPEFIPENQSLEKRDSAWPAGIPATLAELAAMKGEALEIIEARIQVLETLRKAAIRATSPEDWLLFRSPDGSITAYLQDCGADRVRDLYGIEIFDVSDPHKETAKDCFVYLIRGSGRCKLTKQVVENVEGGRSSADDFCANKKGAELELAVRKAARANLDGNITRELAGLKNVPIQELQACWSGTSKSTDRCRQGRGFGSKHERAGVQTQSAAAPKDVNAPICEKCNKTMTYVQGGTRDGRSWDPYWRCPDYAYDREKRQHNGHSLIKNAEMPRQQPQEERFPGMEG